MKLLSLFTFLFIISLSTLGAQTRYQSATIGFYNVENLFDPDLSADLVNKKYPFTDPRYKTSMSEEKAKKIVEEYKNSSDTADYEMYVDYQILNDEFTPKGKKNFTPSRYEKKLQNLADIISDIGRNKSQNAPVIMGLAEVENKQVIEDLIQQDPLKDYHYGIVHFNSYDARGIDVALIYQKGRFIVQESKRYIVELPAEPDGRVFKTRDILRVSGLLDGENFTFIVNHWPSRRGGEKASQPKRNAAAKVMKEIVEEVQSKNPNEKIIAMGDFNDDPISESIQDILQAKGNQRTLSSTDLYSPMYRMYKDGQGTLAYRDSWNLFDMMFLSSNLVKEKNTESYHLFKTLIFSNHQMVAKEGQFKGYPRRMYGGDTFDSKGYSDHFPVYSILIRELK